MSRKLNYHNNCVNWDRDDVHSEGGLCDMIDQNKTITRQTFLKHVSRHDRQHLESVLGYAPHDKQSRLTMKRDHHVSYHRSKLHGATCYYFKLSAIEYVFK